MFLGHQLGHHQHDDGSVVIELGNEDNALGCTWRGRVCMEWYSLTWHTLFFLARDTMVVDSREKLKLTSPEEQNLRAGLEMLSVPSAFHGLALLRTLQILVKVTVSEELIHVLM